MKQTKTMRNLSGFILHLHSCDILYKIAVCSPEVVFHSYCIYLLCIVLQILRKSSMVHGEKERRDTEERRGEEVGDRRSCVYQCVFL